MALQSFSPYCHNLKLLMHLLIFFLVKPDCRIPRTIGVSIPMKATFFITYIMVDGWAGIASEILRLKPLVIFHLKNLFIVKTDRDREKAMDPGSVEFPETLPSLQLYFLLGIVYAVVTPILLPFILVFFAFAYLVYRHQVRYPALGLSECSVHIIFLIVHIRRAKALHFNTYFSFYSQQGAQIH